MIEVEFIQAYKCYKKGDKKNAHLHFAKVLIDQGFAKAVNAPMVNKMIESPVMEK